MNFSRCEREIQGTRLQNHSGSSTIKIVPITGQECGCQVVMRRKCWFGPASRPALQEAAFTNASTIGRTDAGGLMTARTTSHASTSTEIDFISSSTERINR